MLRMVSLNYSCVQNTDDYTDLCIKELYKAINTNSLLVLIPLIRN